ncbi:4170_t:CDS:2 [Funneliformis caledonium]|uniref:4170_t:CDS:1 n=1 Tax=Funneliformis caledonium TaxID=1117310 RepID=A0A9N9F4W4_9GLOM|nr:4170_t:CDS:2 [Funneliformis caledonium]
MRRISLNIKEGAKVSVLSSIVGENIAQPLWKNYGKPNNFQQYDEERTSGSETDISSNTDDSEDEEVIIIHNVNNVQ